LALIIKVVPFSKVLMIENPLKRDAMDYLTHFVYKFLPEDDRYMRNNK